MWYNEKVLEKTRRDVIGMKQSKGAIMVGSITMISTVAILFTTSMGGILFHKEIETQQPAMEIYERGVETTARSSIDRTKEKKKIEIAKDMDLTVRCGLTKEEFKELIRKLTCDKTKFFYDNSNTIYELCEKYELNEIFFCGLIAAESGWSISSRHREKCNYISMMSKGKLIRYDSEEEGLEAAAKLLHNKYLTEDGTYYRGKTLEDVRKGFCPKIKKWTNLVYEQMEQIVEAYKM